MLGVAIARPMVAVLGRYAARFSVRALDLTLDASMLWVGVGLALLAAVLLAFVPRLPSTDAKHGFALTSGGVRITGATNRRLRMFAVTQIAASFVLLAGAGMLLKTLLSLQAARPGFETSNVLAVNVPVSSFGRTPEQIRGFYREMQRRVSEIPGVDRVALGSTVPWRDGGNFGDGFQFSVEGRTRENGQDDPRARFRSVSPGFFAALGMPIVAGRDFNESDRLGAEPVVIVSAGLARQFFPGQDPLNRHLIWTDGVMKFIGISTDARRIVGVTADIDDERVDPKAVMTVYHPFEQQLGGRLFVHTRGDPYALVPTITRTVRELASDQVVERAATLDDVRAEVLAPDRLNAIVFGGFAAVALAISIVGVAGVLAFSVSGRTREFGIRLAIGSQPREILTGVLGEGMWMTGIGVVAGAAAGFVAARVAGSYIQNVQLPGLWPVTGVGGRTAGRRGDRVVAARRACGAASTWCRRCAPNELTRLLLHPERTVVEALAIDAVALAARLRHRRRVRLGIVPLAGGNRRLHALRLPSSRSRPTASAPLSWASRTPRCRRSLSAGSPRSWRRRRHSRSRPRDAARRRRDRPRASLSGTLPPRR